MESTSAELASALLQWINSFEIVNVHELRQLADGRILWSILRDAEGEYFNSRLPESIDDAKDNWVLRKQNLKFVLREISTFIKEELLEYRYVSEVLTPDLEEIARENSKPETMKLVKLVFIVALNSSSKARIVGVLQKLKPEVQKPIMLLIQELKAMDEELGKEAEQAKTGSTSQNAPGADSLRVASPVERDPILEQEEMLIKAEKENQAFRAKVTDLEDTVTEYKEKLSTLEVQLIESNLHVDRSRAKAYDDEQFRKLKEDHSHQADLIAELENELATAQHKLEVLERKMPKIKADSQENQDLRDALQIARQERDDLAQVNKKNENLKKKIESLQNDIRRHHNLERELAEAHEQIKTLDNLQAECAALRKANEESGKALMNNELAVDDYKMKLRQMEFELRQHSQTAEHAVEFQQRAEEQNRELMERIRELEVDTHQQSDSVLLGTLDDELSVVTDHENVKTSPAASDANLITLKQRMEILQARYERLEEQHFNTLQENMALQHGIRDGQGPFENTGSSNPFIQLHERLTKAEEEREALRSEVFATTSQNAELKTEIATLRENIDVSAQDQEVEKTKSKTEYETLADYYAKLQKHCEVQKIDNENLQSSLRHAILRDSTNQEGDQISAEFTLVLEQLKIVRETPEAESEKVMTSTAADLSTRLETGRNKVAECTQRLERQTALIDTLTREIEDARNVAARQVKQSSALDYADLRRENRLMTSAWYDTVGRLQSNTVVLQRRTEPPRSWVRKQMATVGAVGTRR